MRDPYYFAAAASILGAIQQEGSDTDKRIVLTRALRLGCVTLRKLATDLSPGGEIDWAIQHLTSSEAEEVAPEALIPRRAEGVRVRSLDDRTRKRIESAAGFLEVFVKEEERVLRESGMPDASVRFISSQAKESVQLLDGVLRANPPGRVPDRAQLTWERLRQSVTALGEEICSQVQQIEDLTKMRGYARKSVYALCGAGVIKMNTTVDVVTTLGMLPWMTVWSGKLGASLWARAAGILPFPDGGAG